MLDLPTENPTLFPFLVELNARPVANTLFSKVIGEIDLTRSIFEGDRLNFFASANKIGTTVVVYSATKPSSRDESLECSHKVISVIICNCFQLYGFSTKTEKNNNICRRKIIKKKRFISFLIAWYFLRKIKLLKYRTMY